jgi:hypothetical protein
VRRRPRGFIPTTTLQRDLGVVSAIAAFAVAWSASGCLHSNRVDDAGWTVAQAESIRVIRGTAVTVRGCRGIGPPDATRFRRFDCVAGARLPADPADTVAVLYELRPLAPYDAASPRYTLAKVRFVGGPGIP